MNKSNKKSQKTSGVYKLITLPWFYNAFQASLGAKQANKRYIIEWLELSGEQSVLDVGCGPGSLLDQLQYNSYIGIDLNPDHIAFAQNKYGNAKTKFYTGFAQNLIDKLDGKFDRIICSGFLHHVRDDDVRSLIDRLISKLSPNGYIALLEPVFLINQRLIARCLKKLDSGQHIRTDEEWCNLFSGCDIEWKITNDLANVPYDHIWLKLRPKS